MDLQPQIPAREIDHGLGISMFTFAVMAFAQNLIGEHDILSPDGVTART